ncbi:hypothetical protein FACS1894184_04460 [Clostridia bacterium]|nr:hypothetical protein FACS1894184_04460 [Clostridia bacterium]
MFENLSDVAYIGDKLVKGKIRAVILRFHGLGATGFKTALDPDELEWANTGALIVYPYCGPWAWMNHRTRMLIDEIVDRVYKDYELSNNVPLIITGGSMGGHAALNYARFSQHKPAAVVALYPVTDTAYHATERADLPRTFLIAYGLDNRPIADVFHENSPLYHVDEMPRVPYLIVHGDQDKAVNKAAHSDKFVKAMHKVGHDIEYIEASGMDHGPFVDFDLYRRYVEFVSRFIADDCART